MKTEFRNAVHPDDFQSYDTTRIRKEFLVENIFVPGEISLVYSLYDRLIVGGAMPIKEMLRLETIDELKSPDFLDRREMGIINTGGNAIINTEKGSFELAFKDALYLGQGTRDITFMSVDPMNPGRLYFNSAPAHKAYPCRKITVADAERSVLGSMEASNHRTLNKLLVRPAIETCQLQMGMTELMPGSVWNTMPPHTHNRRMEAYFYFELPEKQAICHFMGNPEETRHLWLKNGQAVLSPSWSIHSAAGTSSYTFIWGMAGENLDYGDMDIRQPESLR